MNNKSQDKNEEEQERDEPRIRNEKKYGLGAYKSEEGFQVRGTGTPAEEREENRSAAEN